jgi:CRISPR/Cas system-associated protein Csm6
VKTSAHEQGHIRIESEGVATSGRIERLWGTFQDLLASELRHTADDVLRRFLPGYNRSLGHARRETEKAWRASY